MTQVNAQPMAARFWQYCAQGQLRLTRCSGCGTWMHPPQEICRECGSSEISWKAVSGRATLISFAIYHHDFGARLDLPYTVILVRLEEGPVMVSRLAGGVSERLEIGASLQVAFHEDSEGRNLPLFRLLQ